MKFNCIKCKQPILPENINVQTDLALCKGCGHVERLSSLVDTDFDQSVLQAPPKGAWYRETMSEQVFGATTRHAIAFFMVPFMCVWSGGSLGGIYGTQIISGEFNLFMSLFGIPFLAGSIMFWSIAMMAVCGKVEVTLRDQFGTIFVGVGRLGWRRTFNLDEVDTIAEENTSTRYPGRGNNAISLRGKTKLSFGTNLSEARRYFILNALKLLKARRSGSR